MEANLDFYNDVMKKSPRLAHRYKLVRFEDIAMAPVDYVEDIYEFIGHSPTTHVLDWVNSSTTNQNPRHEAFGTQRDSKQVVSKWRSELAFRLVQIVQDNCSSVMRKLNYQIFQTIDDYRNQNISTYHSEAR